MNNSTTNTVLDDDATLTWLEKRSVDKSLDYAEVDEILRHVPALCATVRALRAENERLKRETGAARQLLGKDLRGQIEGVFGDQEHVETKFRKRAIQICRDRASEWGYLGLSNTWYAGKEEAANDLATELEQLK